MGVMGIKKISSCTSDCCDLPNPNPKRFVIEDIYTYTRCHVLVVKYPDCTNFEGKKILLVKGEFRLKDELDPHFCEDNNIIARFRPTDMGLKLAQRSALQIDAQEASYLR